MQDAWTDILVSSFREVAERLALVAPRLLALGTLLLGGILAAVLARRLTVRLLRAAAFDARCGRWGVTASLARGGLAEPPTALLGRLVFWLLLLVTGLLGIEALEWPALAGLGAAVLHFLPNLLVAGLILGAGGFLATLLAQVTLRGAVNAQVAGAPLLAGAVRWLVLVFAGAAALTQLGIAREMVLLAFGIAFGGTVLALALAFGLGGKELAREILESRLRKREEEGDSVTHV
jgi:hypothetical protein